MPHSYAFLKSARQWWASLWANGEVPKTWKALRASITKQFLASNAKDKVLIKWRSLKLSPYESIHKYVDKFEDFHLKATLYKKIYFEEKNQIFCAGLPEDMNEYVNSQRPKSISAVIHHTMVAARINFQQGAKRNLKTMEEKDKQEYKGKISSQNSSKGNSNNNKVKEKRVFKGEGRASVLRFPARRALLREQLQHSTDRLELESRQQQLSTSWKRVFVAEKVVVAVSSMGSEPSFALLPEDLGEVEKVQVVNKVHLAGSVVGTYDALMASSSSVADGFLNVDVALEERVLNFTQNSTKQKDNWASKKFDHWRKFARLELYKLERVMFSRGSDELEPFVRFCERSSKNYKVDLNHFQPEHFRSPVTVRDADVFATYSQLMRHMPAVVEGDKNLAFMFLQPISNPRTEVWFNRNKVSLKSLSSLVKSIGEKSGVVGNFSNKSLRNTCVTRMSLGQVPREVCMLVTGHKRVSSYDKYDMSSKVRMAAAQDILSQPYDKDRFYWGWLNPQVTMVEESLLFHVYPIWGRRIMSKSWNLWLGDDIPFDENLLNELPFESARALGIASRSLPTRGGSIFPVCNMNNRVVNVYVGKDAVPFEK
ncbi:hypothetical protein L7F22_046617 [Adiantum nelumboides]|nr:hypothetical protein [Adiantum nelumboides]